MIQIVVLLALVVLVTRVGRLADAVAISALMPVAFLITNRIFSVQYFVLLLVAWAIAAALVVESSRDAVHAAVAMTGATLANALILPVPINRPYAWEVMSALRFGLGIALSVWLVAYALRSGRPGYPARTARPPGV